MAGVFDDAYVEAVLAAVERIPPGQVPATATWRSTWGSAALGWSAG